MEEKRTHQNSAHTTENKLNQPAQTQHMQAMAPPPFQLMAQPAPVVQKMESEEEEGEALQMKVNSAETVQRMATEDEEEGPFQMKWMGGGTVQKMESDEEEKEPFQMKAIGTETAQLMATDEEEKEPFQMKPIQLQGKADGAEGGKKQAPKPNNTGLPDNLKAGIENLSGYSMDDVKVHYNSDKPAQLQAHAYAQGTDIHIGPGQEKHLPHEAWHVVQQKQGRVKPTVQMEGGEQVNDDAGLETEADVMGAKAGVHNSVEARTSLKQKEIANIETTQRVQIVDYFYKQDGTRSVHSYSANSFSELNGILSKSRGEAYKLSRRDVGLNKTNFQLFNEKMADSQAFVDLTGVAYEQNANRAQLLKARERTFNLVSETIGYDSTSAQAGTSLHQWIEEMIPKWYKEDLTKTANEQSKKQMERYHNFDHFPTANHIARAAKELKRNPTLIEIALNYAKLRKELGMRQAAQNKFLPGTNIYKQHVKAIRDTQKAQNKCFNTLKGVFPNQR